MTKKLDVTGGIPPFQTIREASKTTGISQYFIREGVKQGWVPHIMTGAKYLVNVEQFLEVLSKRSLPNVDGLNQ